MIHSKRLPNGIKSLDIFLIACDSLHAWFLTQSLFIAMVSSLTLLLPDATVVENETVVEFTVYCQTRLQSKFKGTVDSCLFLTVIRDAYVCSLFQNVLWT